MFDVFIEILNMSLSASVLIAVVIVLRFLLRGAPRYTRHIGVGRGGVGDEAAGERFHCDETHTGVFAGFDYLYIALGCEIAERELQRLIEPGLDSLFCNVLAVVRDADVSDLSGLLGFERRLIEACAVAWLYEIRVIVELIEVYVVRLEHFEAGLEVALELIRVFGLGFGGDHELAANMAESLSELCLTVGIASGCVEKVDAVVKSFLKQIYRLVGRYPLDGEAAEAVFADFDAGFAKCDSLHC